MTTRRFGDRCARRDVFTPGLRKHIFIWIEEGEAEEGSSLPTVMEFTTTAWVVQKTGRAIRGVSLALTWHINYFEQRTIAYTAQGGSNAQSDCERFRASRKSTGIAVRPPWRGQSRQKPSFDRFSRLS